MQGPEAVLESEPQKAESDDAVTAAATSPALATDDFLQVKAAVRPEEPQAAEPSLAEDAPPAKKRKKLKINPGKTSGSRIVFDEEGTGVEPLAAMADTGGQWQAPVPSNLALSELPQCAWKSLSQFPKCHRAYFLPFKS